MPKHAAALPSGLELVEQLTPQQVEQLHLLYNQEWWTKDRTLSETQRVVAGSSLNLGIIDAMSSDLIGYARVLTDHVIKALVLDVIVRRDQRGRKLGVALMNHIIGHASLSSVKHFELYCLPEMVPFYANWGFTSELGTLRFMRRA